MGLHTRELNRNPTKFREVRIILGHQRLNIVIERDIQIKTRAQGERDMGSEFWIGGQNGGDFSTILVRLIQIIEQSNSSGDEASSFLKRAIERKDFLRTRLNDLLNNLKPGSS